MLFNSSVRMNLDPFGEAEDAALWSALERVQLKRRIQQLEGGGGHFLNTVLCVLTGVCCLCLCLASGSSYLFLVEWVVV